MQDLRVFVCLFVYRLVNALTNSTFFQPDEFYQSLEPAHSLVYGYGYLTWEYQTALRSIAHPLVFAVPYWILKVLSLDSPHNVVLVGPLIGALQGAVADYYTAKFIHKYWPETGLLAFVVPLFSSWNWYVGTRTFSNSLETSITAFALYHWPFISPPRLENDVLFYEYVMTTVKSLSALGFAFLTRPTTALLWIVPALRQIQKHKTTFFFEAVFVAYVVLQYSAIIDSFYYGSISFPILNFLRFNTSGAASFYGVNQWHYYVTQGLPMLLTFYLPFALRGLTRRHVLRRELLYMCAFVVSVYSVLGHKEARFIMPLLPILHAFTASAIHSFLSATKVLSKFAIIFILALNMTIALYASRVHQSGVMNLMTHVRDNPEIESMTLLMPCHSTPWQSHIHRPMNVRFLTCEPPLGLEQLHYRDEADQFYDDPSGFLRRDVRIQGTPDYYATFEASQSTLEQYWTVHGQVYHLERRWFNSHFHDDARRKGDVLLYRMRAVEKSNQSQESRMDGTRQGYQAFL